MDRPFRRAALLISVCAIALTPAAVALAPTSADPGNGWTVTSPGGALTATVAAHSGTYELTVARAGRPVLAATLGGHPGAAAGARTQDDVHETYATPTGKRRSHTLTA